MKKNIVLMALLSAVLIGTTAWAGDVTIPKTFTAGTTAVASEVNDNFTAVESAVDDNNTRINTNAANIAANAADITTNVTDITTNVFAIAALNESLVAYANINSDGTFISGTSNVSSSWNPSSARYEITISGESYIYFDYVTVVTPSGGPYIARTGSVSGDLLVIFYDLGGNPAQVGFQFVTYKP